MKPINRFTLAVFLWLPVCFAVWYYMSILFVAAIAAAVDALLQALAPAVISEVQQQGNGLLVVTQGSVQQMVEGVLRSGELVFELNALKYGYSVPLYTALVLAIPSPEAQKLDHWIVGILVLFAAQAAGVATEVLKVLAFDLGPEMRAALGFSGAGHEILALAYQFSVLILPSVTPILLWVGQFRRALPEITGLPPVVPQNRSA